MGLAAEVDIQESVASTSDSAGWALGSVCSMRPLPSACHPHASCTKPIRNCHGHSHLSESSPWRTGCVNCAGPGLWGCRRV